MSARSPRCCCMQWALQNPITRTYLENQRMNNRVTAQGYTAWDNIFSGNRYNLRLWLAGFKTRLREALTAQIRAIVAREGMSAMSGIVSLAIVFATMTVVARAQRRQHGDADRAGDDAAAADRDDLRAASARHRLERFHRDLDALRRGRRQHAAAARAGPSTTASNSTGWCCARARTPTSSRRSTTRCASCWRSRPAASTSAAPTAPANPRCWPASRPR